MPKRNHQGQPILKQPKTHEEETNNNLLRMEAHLHLALASIYMQSSDDIHITLGKDLACEYCDCYENVLDPKKDICDVYVRGYNSQGRVRPVPDLKKHYKSPQDFKILDAEAHFIKSTWIYSHFILAPCLDMYSPDFNKGVALVKRAAETMVRVSGRIYQTAIDLAEGMLIKDKVLAADKAAQDALVFPSAPLPALVVEDAVILTHEQKVRPPTAPRLPYDFVQYLKANKYVVDPTTKDAKRLAFESEVLDVFSFGVCIAYEDWHKLGDIMLTSTTHLRKCYDEMTPEEHKLTGSVVLQTIMDDLKDGRAEEAIIASLAAARSLTTMAARLEAACAALVVAAA